MTKEELEESINENDCLNLLHESELKLNENNKFIIQSFLFLCTTINQMLCQKFLQE